MISWIIGNQYLVSLLSGKDRGIIESLAFGILLLAVGFWPLTISRKLIANDGIQLKTESEEKLPNTIFQFRVRQIRKTQNTKVKNCLIRRLILSHLVT
jgi:hypothetical protein